MIAKNVYLDKARGETNYKFVAAYALVAIAEELNRMNGNREYHINIKNGHL